MRFRSKFRNYRFGPGPIRLVFERHVATTDDPRIIAAAQASPRFGVGKDFWEETPAMIEHEQKALDESAGSDGDGAPAHEGDAAATSKKTAKKTAKKTTRKKGAKAS